MVLVHTALTIKPGLEADFEEAFQAHRHIPENTAGFRSLVLARSSKHPQSYLLLSEWDNEDDHKVAFHNSAAFEVWRTGLNSYYQSPPQAVYFNKLP